jgi:hypothetical protein
MPDASGPILLVVGGDTKRLQWLTHHVTSHWPSAQVTTAARRRNRLLSAILRNARRTPSSCKSIFANEPWRAPALKSP